MASGKYETRIAGIEIRVEELGKETNDIHAELEKLIAVVSEIRDNHMHDLDQKIEEGLAALAEEQSVCSEQLGGIKEQLKVAKEERATLKHEFRNFVWGAGAGLAFISLLSALGAILLAVHSLG